jgi:carbon monoxide dehydrogenase subunit G
MKVTGTARLNAPVEQVWRALNDPAVLVRTIPGCEQLEAVGTDRYRMTVTAGVASIKGTYLGDVELTDQQPPGSFTLRASGSGAPGTVQADVKVQLDDAGGGTTTLRYDADAVVGGPVGGVGQRMLAGVARKTAGEFFAAVDDVLNSAAPAPSTTGPGTAPSDEPGAAPAAAPRLFSRPPPARSGAALDVRSQLVGVLVGAAVALAGVVLGWSLARRRS